jgi:LPS-assembly protein
MDLIFSQRLSQKYYPDRVNKLSELHNEMVYIWDNWTFYNYLIYSHEFSDIYSLSSAIEIKEDTYQFELSHSFKKNLSENINSIATNDLNFDFKYSFNQRVRLNGGFTYDIENKESTQWKMGIGYFKDCWSIDTSLRRDVRATSVGSETLNTFYLQLNFIPFGGVGTGDFK